MPRSTSVRPASSRAVRPEDFGGDPPRRLGQGASGKMVGDIIARQFQRGSRGARRQGDDAVFDLPVLPDQHHQRPRPIERHDTDLRQLRIAMRHHHHPRRARQVGEDRAGRLKRLLDRARRPQLAFDGALFFLARLGNLHDPVDEHPQALFGRHAPGAGMRRGEQTQPLQLAQHRADRGGREVQPALAAQGLGANRLAAIEIALDHHAENLARTFGQVGNRWGCHDSDQSRR